MHLIFRICAGTLGALLALPASAEPPAAAEATVRPVAAVPQAIAAPPERLDTARGGSDGIASDTRVQGGVTGNSATNVNSGTNMIQAGSFAHTVGLPVVIQNSGANVLIQSATVINLQFK